MQTAADKEAARILTILLPIKMVVKVSSALFVNFSAFSAFLLPFFANLFSRSFWLPVRAVSEAEKNADRITSKISTKVKDRREPLNIFMAGTFREICLYYRKNNNNGQIFPFYVIIAL